MKKYRSFCVNISLLTLVIRLVKYKIEYAIVEYRIIELNHIKTNLFYKKTSFSDHNDDGVQIVFATHMAESIEPFNSSMSVFPCDQNIEHFSYYRVIIEYV